MIYNVLFHGKDLIVCPAFNALVMSAKESFERALSLPTTPKTPTEIVKQYGPSFDLFNLGFVFAHIACPMKPGSKQRKALFDLARRLTHYGDPDFTMDPIEAWRVYKKMR